MCDSEKSNFTWQSPHNPICDILYHQRYYPTVFSPPNNPWYGTSNPSQNGNVCPFGHIEPILQPTIYPPEPGTPIVRAKPLSIQPNYTINPIHGLYGQPSDPTLKGYTKTQTDNCAWGFYSVNLDGQHSACCNVFGEC